MPAQRSKFYVERLEQLAAVLSLSALIWQHGNFELGLGSKYLVAPIDGVQFMLMSGTRF